MLLRRADRVVTADIVRIQLGGNEVWWAVSAIRQSEDPLRPGIVFELVRGAQHAACVCCRTDMVEIMPSLADLERRDAEMG